MKLLILSFILISLSYSVSAQAVKSEKSTGKPLVVLGLQAGVFQSFQNADFDVQYGNLFTGSGNFFIRFYMGKHLSLETGAGYSISEKDFTFPVNYRVDTAGYTKRGVRAYSKNIPLSILYHLGTPLSRIRPYFGVGTGIVSREYHINDEYILNYSAGAVRSYNYIDEVRFISVQLIQGMTCQLSNSIQFNESFYYLYEHNSGRNNIGLNLGLGYTIR